MNRRQDFWTEFRRAHDLATERLDHVPELLSAMPLVAPRRPRKPGIRLGALGFGLAAAAALVLVLLVVLRPGAPPEPALSFVVGDRAAPGQPSDWIAASDDAPLPITFSDGSRFLLGPTSRARVLSTSTAGGHLVIEQGVAEVGVVHLPGSHWLLEAGPFEIEIVGTRFEARWSPATERLEVRLHEGALRVSGAFLADAVALSEGQTLIADGRSQRSELLGKNARHTLESELAAPEGDATPEGERAPSSAPSPDDTVKPQPSPGAPPAPAGTGPSARAISATASASASASASEDWLSLAAEGRYEQAHAWLARRGFEAACAVMPATRLVQAGDVARLSGHAANARHAYTKARSAGANADMAAYGLGLLAFHAEGRFGEAARWFRTYLSEQAGGALRPEAMARLMEAERNAGNLAASRRAARAYLDAYPEGAHAALARRLLRR